METMWTCKVGVLYGIELPCAADSPMREAIAKAFLELTGEEPDFIFSGWSGRLNPIELAIVKDDYNLIPEDPIPTA